MYIATKDFAKFFFFTDGCAKFPTEEMKNVEEYFEKNHELFRSSN